MGKRSALLLVLAGLALPSPAAADRFIATSGVPHRDVADVRWERGWNPGDGIGTSPEWEAAIDNVLAAMASVPGVDATLMTGDLVGGYWGRDRAGTGIFGPVRTVAQRRAAVRRAARTYYAELRHDWAAHPGLGTVLPAMGDHEAGDLPPSGWRRPGSHQHRMFPTAKRSWARAFGWRPRYAVQLPGTQDVRVATLLPVRRTRAGLSAALGPRQLEWLDSVFRGYDGWKVIQVEVPPSPASQARYSSGLWLRDGAALWAKAREMGVHVIFSAEVHVLSAMQQPGFAEQPGPVVVTNGGAMFNGADVHFVVADVAEETLTLTGRTVPCRTDGVRRLWQTTLRSPLAAITCSSSSAATGRLELDRAGAVITSEGLLALPTHEPLAPVGVPWQELM